MTYRDSHHPGAHAVRLDNVDLLFDANGELQATPEQARVLSANPLRRARFAPVEETAAVPERTSSPGTQAGEPGAEPGTACDSTSIHELTPTEDRT